MYVELERKCLESLFHLNMELFLLVLILLYHYQLYIHRSNTQHKPFGEEEGRQDCCFRRCELCYELCLINKISKPKNQYTA